jgi:nitroimidazol reductase NimA-like FMN-containing flavoprotein (pyridoxamine 5'-phosphate oxidase superfamily)
MTIEAVDYMVTTDVLEDETCWRLLARAWVGHVGFVDDEGQTVLPVNCAVSDGVIVFRTGRDSRLYALRDGAPVAFEVDHSDRVAEAGWSVLVRGHVWEVTDVPELEALSDVPLHPWVEGTKDRWMKIVPSTVTGRVTSRHRVGSGVPYMPPD